MSERKKLNERIDAKRKLIRHLKREISELKKEAILLCDETQWYTEETQEHIISKKPKVVEQNLIGLINWYEEFKDEDTGETLTLKRNEIVSVNGKWLDYIISED